MLCSWLSCCVSSCYFVSWSPLLTSQLVPDMPEVLVEPLLHNIGALILNNYLYYFGGFLLQLEYNGPRNPILIIQAPILNRHQRTASRWPRNVSNPEQKLQTSRTPRSPNAWDCRAEPQGPKTLNPKVQVSNNHILSKILTYITTILAEYLFIGSFAPVQKHYQHPRLHSFRASVLLAKWAAWLGQCLIGHFREEHGKPLLFRASGPINPPKQPVETARNPDKPYKPL